MQDFIQAEDTTGSTEDQLINQVESDVAAALE